MEKVYHGTMNLLAGVRTKRADCAPDEVGEEVEDAGEDGGDGGVEQGNDVHHVLQALRARLIQPCIHLRPALLRCERGGVRDLRHSRACMSQVRLLGS